MTLSNKVVMAFSISIILLVPLANNQFLGFNALERLKKYNPIRKIGQIFDEPEEYGYDYDSQVVNTIFAVSLK